MAQEEYDLDVLLSLREQDKSQAEDALACALAELTRCEQAVAQAQQNLQDAITQRRAACAAFDDRMAKQGGAIMAMRQFDDYVRDLKRQEADLQLAIDEAVQAHAAQKQDAFQKQATLADTIRELKAVEQHHQQWLQEQDRQTQRKQSLAMDDIAARLWRSQHESE